MLISTYQKPNQSHRMVLRDTCSKANTDKITNELKNIKIHIYKNMIPTLPLLSMQL